MKRLRLLLPVLLAASALAQSIQPYCAYMPDGKCPTGPLKINPLGTPSRPLSANNAPSGPAMSATPLHLRPQVPAEHLLPATASLVAGINLRSLRDSGSMQLALDKVASLGASLPHGGIADLNRSMSMLNGIDSILFAIEGTEAAPKPLIVLTGQFQDAPWARQFHLSPVRLADANTILIGSQPAISAAMTHVRLTPPPPSNMAIRAAAFSARYDVWMIAEQPELVAQLTRRLPAAIQLGNATVRGLEFGFALRNNVEMLVTLMTPSREMADKLEASLKAQAATSAQKFEWERFDTSLRVRISTSRDALAGAAPPEKTPEHPGKVVIYGLEEKPKTLNVR